MRDVPRLLVAIDLHRDGTTLTAGSCLATDHAAELVKQLDAEVVLLHSIGSSWASSHGAHPSLDCAQRTLDQVADRSARSASPPRSRSATRHPGARSCGA